MHRSPLVILTLLTATIGCQTTQPHRSYFVRPETAAQGNVDESGGNVFVHISNQGSQQFLFARFQITNADGSGRARTGQGAIEFDPIGDWCFAYSLPAGEYRLHFTDDIGGGYDAYPWTFAFTVAKTGRPVHLDLSYWLGVENGETHGERQRYAPHVEFEVADQAPAGF